MKYAIKCKNLGLSQNKIFNHFRTVFLLENIKIVNRLDIVNTLDIVNRFDIVLIRYWE